MAQGSNAQKVPLARSLNEMARKRILDSLQLEGKELPASIVSLNGWIATVKFELDAPDFTLPEITVPVLSSVYDYLPFQEGNLGVVMSIDTYLGGISGLGGGTAQLGIVPNLTALIFVPCGNVEFKAPADPKVRLVQGPNGVILQTMDGTDDAPPSSIVSILKDGITAQHGDAKALLTDTTAELAFGDDNYIKITSSGVEIKGTLTINGNPYLDHQHSGVQTGGSNSGGVVP